MESWKYVIVGAGPAGLTAADAIRRNDSAGSILVVSGEAHRPYSRVMLPDLLSGEKPLEQLYLHPEDFYAGRGVDTKFGSPVTSVDLQGHSVRLSDGQTIGYDKLLLATGSSALRLDVPGGDLPNVHYFHDLDDALSLKPVVSSGDRVLVYGGGLVALELAVALKDMKADVSVAMRGAGFFWRSISKLGGVMVAAQVRENGVPVSTDRGIVGIVTGEQSCTVEFSDGTKEEFGTVVVGVGARPKLDFLKGSGLEVGKGVPVDSRMRTEKDGVYAAGDAALFIDTFSGRRRTAGNWQSAVFQGQSAGINMSGGDREFRMVTGNAVDCFGLPVAFVGDSGDPDAETLERDYGRSSSLRLFLKGGRIVGATCVGRFTDRAAVTQLIQRQVEISGDDLVKLQDPAEPMANLLN